MTTAELFGGITEEEYHADPADGISASSSVLRLLCTHSPAHARAAHPKLNPDVREVHRKDFDVGNAAHGILLEGADRIDVHEYPDWKKGAAQEARAASYAAGRIPLLTHQAENTYAMVDAVARQIREFGAAPPLLGILEGGRSPGQPEATIVWDERGVQCRARADWLHLTSDEQDWGGGVPPPVLGVVDDLKTTGGNAAPEKWSRAVFDRGYDIQAALYLRALRALGAERPRWRWVVCEAYPPYAVSVLEPGPDTLAVADAKIDYALEVWKRCLDSGRWPAYPPHIATVELPPWEEPRWLEREARG